MMEKHLILALADAVSEGCEVTFRKEVGRNDLIMTISSGEGKNKVSQDVLFDVSGLKQMYYPDLSAIIELNGVKNDLPKM